MTSVFRETCCRFACVTSDWSPGLRYDVVASMARLALSRQSREERWPWWLGADVRHRDHPGGTPTWGALSDVMQKAGAHVAVLRGSQNCNKSSDLDLEQQTWWHPRDETGPWESAQLAALRCDICLDNDMTSAVAWTKEWRHFDSCQGDDQSLKVAWM